MDEDEGGQERREGMFGENQIDIKEEEEQNGDDSGKGNDESVAGIWMVETLRRRLRIGTRGRGKIDVKRARHHHVCSEEGADSSLR